MTFVAVATWTVLGVVGQLGGREARRLERLVGRVFAIAVLVPIYLFHDPAPLMAVVDEIAKPVLEVMAIYMDELSNRSA